VSSKNENPERRLSSIYVVSDVANARTKETTRWEISNWEQSVIPGMHAV